MDINRTLSQHKVVMTKETHNRMRYGHIRQRIGCALLLSIAIAISGCAETEFLAGSVKRMSDEPAKGRYKIGSPYQVGGEWYTPKVDYRYDETGVASWYGKEFHSKPTANGETYDMNAVSAAHKTLPLPSMVRVTNLGNGRVINVRVNDRGPFSSGRIIDLSRKGAQLLGFERQGTALVRVEILPRESQRLAVGLTGAPTRVADTHPVPKTAPRVAVTSQQLGAPPGVREAQPPTPNHAVVAIAKPSPPAERAPATLAQVDGQVMTVPLEKDPQVFVQAGAFSEFANANRVKAMLQGLAPTSVRQIDTAEARLFRVRLGPVASIDDADHLLARVVASGVPQARIVVD